MMNTQQPEALRLADWLIDGEPYNAAPEAAAELRHQFDEIKRLHSVNAVLLEALEVLVNGSGFAPAKNLEKARAAIAKAAGLNKAQE
jgi:hypothetical protein